MNDQHVHAAHEQTPDPARLTTELLQARIRVLEEENAGLKNLWKDARIPVMKALRLQAENESLKAQLTVDAIGGKEGLNLVMALQPLLVAYADATRVYLDPQMRKDANDIEEDNTLYHAMKVAETAIHWFVNARHASSQVAEIAQLQAEVASLKKTWENPRIIGYLTRINELTNLLNATNDRLLETTHTQATLNVLSAEAWARVGVPRLASITTLEGQVEYYSDLVGEIAEENERLSKRLASVADLQAVLESSADLVHRFKGTLTRRGTWAKVNEELDELKEAINEYARYTGAGPASANRTSSENDFLRHDVARELIDVIVTLGGMVAEAGLTWDDIAPAVPHTLGKNAAKTTDSHRWDEATKTVVRLTAKDAQS